MAGASRDHPIGRRRAQHRRGQSRHLLRPLVQPADDGASHREGAPHQAGCDSNSNRYRNPVVRYLTTTTTTTTTTLLLLLLLLCLPPLLLPYPGEGSLRALPRRTGHLRRGDEGKRVAVKQVANHIWLTHHLLTQTLICTCYCDEGGLREEGCCRAGDAPHDNMNTM